MSERISNKKQNFDGIDPQESLIKSLESIKSLLKQGDSKINQARENIARADNLSSDKIQDRLNGQVPEIPNTSFISSASIQKPEIIEQSTDAEPDFSNIPELNDIDEEGLSIEEIVVDSIPEDNIFNSKTKALQSEVEDMQTIATPQQADNAPLNELYDHDLIVPMLDEIIIPEDQNSSLFNMDSSVEIKFDPKMTSKLIELSNTDESSSENSDDISLKSKVAAKDEVIKSAYNSIKKSDIEIKKPNADIISFELSSNAIRNNLKKSANKAIESKITDIPELKEPENINGISLVEDSSIELEIDVKPITAPVSKQKTEHVIIKETTNDKLKVNDIPAIAEKTDIAEKSTKALKTKNSMLNIDLTSALDTANYTDEILTDITASNSKITKPKITVQSPVSEEIDFSKIEGLDRLKFNADKMGALQKRVEKRVHNRLIQLIVQLDDEIKTIFNDEIKNCVAHELENLNKEDNKNKK